jgi:hypothetical protein
MRAWLYRRQERRRFYLENPFVRFDPISWQGWVRIGGIELRCWGFRVFVRRWRAFREEYEEWREGF